ncbi:hypothetical protein D9757_005319 [Collybiopsis confluens]|uniref:Chromatin elongation factor SPT5 n=1 Tax=Collybiopsis confluens TaxID=2823264 RepID=A0A8H5M3D6_9AGAR|nr:hypothetical protein D9757_010698 [Collybiopsis confluens]KAF5390457.1 hypothetical protein D9757_005319 [Collybiopsis confluens]
MVFLCEASEAPTDRIPTLQSLEKPPTLDALVERIEERYVKCSSTERSPIDESEDDLPGMRKDDWPLWRLKCTPRKEYFIIYELMMRHATLSDELRAVFYNARDIGYVYLEAQFQKSAISSLREVLREYSDLKLTSLTIVSRDEIKPCLVKKGAIRSVFAAGQWVEIKKGLYRGDIGLVADDFRDDDSVAGVKVMVVPRLDFEDQPSTSTAKRKQRLRPSPRLFDPTACTQQDLVPHEQSQIFSYKSWRFEYGLQIKIFSERVLSPARQVPPSICSIFMDAKAKGADIDMHSMPIHLFWRFEVGDEVIYRPDQSRGVVASPFDPSSLPPSSKSTFIEVEFENEGRHNVLADNLTKSIILGQYVEVLAGVHSGKKGFVIAQSDALLGICVGANGLDFRVHANSVKLSVPDFRNTEVPWLNTPVKLLSGPFGITQGKVKDVGVTSARSLAITVSLYSGEECTVGYHAVRELLTGKLLLDYQPLKRHQQQFNVEAPWKEVQVTVQSGRFAGRFAIVKNARIDSLGSLRLLLWVTSYNISIEIDHSAVREQMTGALLPVYRPLEGNQLKHFGVNTSLESMRTGPVPWLGMVIDIVRGQYKGQSGTVRDVNRYEIASASVSKKSGVKLTVERHVFTVVASTKMVEVDYDAVRFHRTKFRLCDVFLPTARQSFYMPDPRYEKLLQTSSNDEDVEDSAAAGSMTPAAGSMTPLPNDFERETLFYGTWSPNCPTPAPSSLGLTSTSLPSNELASPAPASPPLIPRTSSPVSVSAPAPAPDHWILHPKLIGIPIKVDISGGQLASLQKKDGVIVETVASEDGIKVIYRRSSSKVIEIPSGYIQSFRDRPNPAREKGLMVVARNHPQHIGKLVRRIHHFYDMEKIEEKHWLMMQRVDRSGPKEDTLPEFLEFHPSDLEYVKETPEERRRSAQGLQRMVRKDLKLKLYEGFIPWRETDRITVVDASSQNSPIINISLSNNAQFLAIGYGKQVDIWDLRTAMPTSPRSIYESSVNPITAFAWSPNGTRLALGYQSGIVYVISLYKKSAPLEGFPTGISDIRGGIVAALFLGEDVLAIATCDTAEIRFLDQGSAGERSWKPIGSLPKPPIIQGEHPQGFQIKSMHTVAQGRLLIHYGDGVAVNDICLENELVLLTDQLSGTYTLVHLGTGKIHCQFYPRDFHTQESQPVSMAKFISSEVIISGGVGQLVLWSIENRSRLQNLIYRNQGKACTFHKATSNGKRKDQLVVESLSAAYRKGDNSGWIASAHNFVNRGEVVIWRTVDYDLENNGLITIIKGSSFREHSRASVRMVGISPITK